MPYAKRTTSPRQDHGSLPNSQIRGQPRDGKPRSHTDSASDSSVGATRQRHRENPASRRGKAKRTMTALTTDSDSSSDAQRGAYGLTTVIDTSGKFLRNSITPQTQTMAPTPFPPRIARNPPQTSSATPSATDNPRARNEKPPPLTRIFPLSTLNS